MSYHVRLQLRHLYAIIRTYVRFLIIKEIGTSHPDLWTDVPVGGKITGPEDYAGIFLDNGGRIAKRSDPQPLFEITEVHLLLPGLFQPFLRFNPPPVVGIPRHRSAPDFLQAGAIGFDEQIVGRLSASLTVAAGLAKRQGGARCSRDGGSRQPTFFRDEPFSVMNPKEAPAIPLDRGGLPCPPGLPVSPSPGPRRSRRRGRRCCRPAGCCCPGCRRR